MCQCKECDLNSREESPFGRPRRRLKESIRMKPREGGWEGVGGLDACGSG
jgi:hypothetical protein